MDRKTVLVAQNSNSADMQHTFGCAVCYIKSMGDKIEISKRVDQLFEENDQRAFEIMHRIAALAVKEVVEVLTK